MVRNDISAQLSDRLLTTKQAAEMLGTTERFPRRLIAERRIRFVKLGGHHVRIPESALRQFVEASTVHPVDLRTRGQVA